MTSYHFWREQWPEVKYCSQHLDLSEKNFLEVDSQLLADAFSRFLRLKNLLLASSEMSSLCYDLLLLVRVSCFFKFATIHKYYF